MEKEDEKKIIYLERPVLERGRYMEDAEAQIAASQRLAELQEKRAKRERDMAIFSDIANLVTKGAAVAGGAWKIDKEEAKSAKENERLRALRDSNSKQLAEYAKLRMAAADAQRKDSNAAALAMYNADVDAYKHALEQEKYAKDQERKDKIADSEIKKNEAYANYYNNGGKGTTSKSSASGGKSTGKTKNMRYLGDWGFDIDSTAEVDEAYARMVQADPSKAATKPSLINPKGYEVVENPSTAQKRDALVKGGITREPKKTASVKKGSDKTMPGVGGSNNKKMPGVK